MGSYCRWIVSVLTRFKIYDLQDFLAGIRKFACNFQVIFCVGMTFAIQILLTDYWTVDRPSAPIEVAPSEQGDVIYYWQEKLPATFTEYTKSVLYRLVMQPDSSWVTPCDRSAFDIHDQAGLPLRNVSLFQTLGDTNVHAVTAILDDRLIKQKYIRLLAVGLHPGPGELFCSYQCTPAHDGRCSAKAKAVILLAGTKDDYEKYNKRKSFMDVTLFACPVRPQDEPGDVSLTTRHCGYTHNKLPVIPLNVQGVVAPPWEVGVCVQPVNTERLRMATVEHMGRWLEYWRIMGADQVHFYWSQLSQAEQALLHVYESEKLRLVDSTDWTVMEKDLELAVSDEAAVNHCLMNNMMKNKYILIISFDDLLLFGQQHRNLKELTRSSKFRSEIDHHSGMRVDVLGSPGDRPERSTMLVRSRAILATAAKHFLPLSGKTSFKKLDPLDVSVVDMKNWEEIEATAEVRQLMVKAADSRLKQAKQ